jgi:deoxycytidylate deaminase
MTKTNHHHPHHHHSGTCSIFRTNHNTSSMLATTTPIFDYSSSGIRSTGFEDTLNYIVHNGRKRGVLIVSLSIVLLLMITLFFILAINSTTTTTTTTSVTDSTRRGSSTFDNHFSGDEKDREGTCSLHSVKNAKLKREDVGRATWRFMHIITDNTKNAEEEQKSLQLIKLVSELFPCKNCAKDFQDILSKNPYETMKEKYLRNNKNKEYGAKRYMCDLHNLVNTKLKKPLFNCDDENLDAEYAMTECY